MQLKIRKNIKEGKEIEALKSENAMLRAKLDYIATITDVDISVKEGENEQEALGSEKIL